MNIKQKMQRTLDYPVPLDEDFRLKVLYSHRILDTAPEPLFRSCHAPCDNPFQGADVDRVVCR